MIFDDKIIEFLKKQEEHPKHKCNKCQGKMNFNEKHGFYVCKKCSTKTELVIKAPQVLIKVGNIPLKLYWSNCPDCNFSNVTDETQEKNLCVGIVKGKLRFEANDDQQKISCTNCDCTFKKEK